MDETYEYQIGEIVKVRSRENIPENCPFDFVDRMEKYCGKQATITYATKSNWHGDIVNRYNIAEFDEKDRTWAWSDEMLEHVENVKEEDLLKWNSILEGI